MTDKKEKINVIKELKSFKKGIKDIILTHELGEKILEVAVKQYLPATDKKAIIQLIAETGVVIDEETGLKKVDQHTIEVIKEYLLVKYYTDIKLTDDIFEMYDLLASSGLAHEIIYSGRGIRVSEMVEIEDLLEYEIDEIIRINEVSTGIGHKLETVLKGFNEGLGEAITAINHLDLGSLNLPSLK